MLKRKKNKDLNARLAALAAEPSVQDAVKIIADDLRKFAKWQFENSPNEHGPVSLQRRLTLEYAADYIERAL